MSIRDRYSVNLAVEITKPRPRMTVADQAASVAKLATLLPESAELRGLKLPEESTGVAEVTVDLDAISPADAVQAVSLAFELVAIAAGGMDALGPLDRVSVTRRAPN